MGGATEERARMFCASWVLKKIPITKLTSRMVVGIKKDTYLCKNKSKYVKTRNQNFGR